LDNIKQRILWFRESHFGKPLLKYFSEILSTKMMAIKG